MANCLDKPLALALIVLLVLCIPAIIVLADTPEQIDDCLRVRRADAWPEREETIASLETLIADKRPRMPEAQRQDIAAALWGAATVVWSGPGREALEIDARRHGRVATVRDAAMLLAAQGWNESEFNPRAASRTGDLGFAQINCHNLRWLGIDDWRDVWQNINGQAHYMSDLLANVGRRFGIQHAVAGYNCGGHRVSRGRIPDNGITPAYSARVVRMWRGLLSPAAESRPQEPARTYVVRPGDTLWKIARARGVSVERLAEVNGIKDPNVIRTGRRLVIP
jgi:hypothetical protein